MSKKNSNKELARLLGETAKSLIAVRAAMKAGTDIAEVIPDNVTADDLTAMVSALCALETMLTHPSIVPEDADEHAASLVRSLSVCRIVEHRLDAEVDRARKDGTCPDFTPKTEQQS